MLLISSSLYHFVFNITSSFNCSTPGPGFHHGLSSFLGRSSIPDGTKTSTLSFHSHDSRLPIDGTSSFYSENSAKHSDVMLTITTIPALALPITSDEMGIIFNIPPPGGKTNKAQDTGVEPAQRGSDPQFMLHEHKLGVSVHVVHPLINEARGAFPAARAAYNRARGAVGELAENRPAGDVGPSCSPKHEPPGAADAKRLLSVTRALLLVNADHGSAWNSRKEVVRDGHHGSIREEVKVLYSFKHD